MPSLNPSDPDVRDRASTRTAEHSSWLRRAELALVRRYGANVVAVLAMAVAMLLWIAIEKSGGDLLAEVPPLELVWLRYLVHLGLMLLFVAPRHPAQLFRTRYPLLQIGRSVLMLGMPLFWVMAAIRMPMPTVMAIFWAVPLIAVVLAAVLMRERPSLVLGGLVGLGYLGTFLMLRPPLPPGRGGPVFAVAMAGCFALYLVGTRWLRREPTQVNLFHSALSVFLLLTPVMPFVWRWPTSQSLAPIFMIGVLGYVVLWCLDRALHLATVAMVAPVMFLQASVEMIWLGGIHAGFDKLPLAGIVLVCVAVLGALVHARRRRGSALDERDFMMEPSV